MAHSLFVFGRSLPEPFDGSKTTSQKKSQYSNGTQATLTSGPLKALNAICASLTGTGEGAVGKIDHRCVAEYKSSVDDEYHLAVYDPGRGSVMAAVYDMNHGTVSKYTVSKTARDGAVVLMAMFSVLMEDQEFKDEFDRYKTEHDAGFPDIDRAHDIAAVLCDNIYRRVSDPACTAHVKADIKSSGNLLPVPRTSLDAGEFQPTIVTVGSFQILSQNMSGTAKKSSVVIKHADFIGKYPISGSRQLSLAEKKLVPELPVWHILTKDEQYVCEHILKSTGKPTQIRNIMMRGEAGCGKTSMAMATAAGVGLPYVLYTCSSGTETFDLSGGIMPELIGGGAGDGLDADIAKLQSLGGLTYNNIAKLLQFPDIDDIEYDPASSYQLMTGTGKPDATPQECVMIMLEKAMSKVQQITKATEPKDGQSFTYYESNLLLAIENGWVIELQEPTVIAQPGVLTSLNSLLEQSGSISLPNGKTIRRHPDCIIICTTNVDYAGCRNLNQSFLDRFGLVIDVKRPSAEVMADRAMKLTGYDDEYTMMQMVDIVNGISDHLHKKGINDGTCGMRSLIDWALSALITGDPYKSAHYTVISKATTDERERSSLVTSFLDPILQAKTAASA